MKRLHAPLIGLLLAGLAPASASDGIPQMAVTSFNASTCPADWVVYPDLEGRFIMPVIDPAAVGTQSGTAIQGSSEQAEPVHTHNISGAFYIPPVKYALIAGCCNDSLGYGGTRAFSGTSNFNSVELPYVRMLACQKVGVPPAGAPSLARGSLLFFNMPSCPAGWSAAPTIAGRFIVGLPPNGAPGASFGGTSLSSGAQPTHTHPFSASVALLTQNIAAVSGCCAYDYSSKGSFSASGTSEAASLNYPYKQLLACAKD